MGEAWRTSAGYVEKKPWPRKLRGPGVARAGCRPAHVGQLPTCTIAGRHCEPSQPHLRFPIAPTWWRIKNAWLGAVRQAFARIEARPLP
jgi:hypothetical protein